MSTVIKTNIESVWGAAHSACVLTPKITARTSFPGPETQQGGRGGQQSDNRGRGGQQGGRGGQQSDNRGRGGQQGGRGGQQSDNRGRGGQQGGRGGQQSDNRGRGGQQGGRGGIRPPKEKEVDFHSKDMFPSFGAAPKKDVVWTGDSFLERVVEEEQEEIEIVELPYDNGMITLEHAPKNLDTPRVITWGCNKDRSSE